MIPTVEEIKQHNEVVELLYVCFLDKDGKHTKKDNKAITAKFLFADGKDYDLPVCELSAFNDFPFRVKSSKKDQNETENSLQNS
jgi:hypothetical protein